MRVGCGGSTTEETRFLRERTGLAGDGDDEDADRVSLRTAWSVEISSLKMATRSFSEVSWMRSDEASEGEGTAVSGTAGRTEWKLFGDRGSGV